ncbi:MAG: histidine kinase [Arcicella sp.]|jgi:sensor histidine kinase YesM|nr:histidine kinase [Arcicella sp.]
MTKFLDWYYNYYPLENVPQSRRLWIHICFWLFFGSFAGLSVITNMPLTGKVFAAFSEVVGASLMYYGMTYCVFPRLLSAKTFLLGLILLLLLFYVFLLFRLATFTVCLNNAYYIPKSFLYQYAQGYVKNGVIGIWKDKNFFFELNMILSLTLLPFLLKFSRVIGVYSANINKVSKEKTELEIYFLRTQLNPHFLFNSLNSIYSQVVNQDSSAANSIIVLSNLLKYIISNSADVYVDLTHEINFIRDYIDLEKMRSGNKVRIRYSQEGEFNKYVIAPLILTNYVENAFKHGRANIGEALHIAVDVKFLDEILYFTVENDNVTTNRRVDTPKSGGLGMINTRRRLELLYPQKHTLNVINTDTKFRVEIQIKLNM